MSILNVNQKLITVGVDNPEVWRLKRFTAEEDIAGVLKFQQSHSPKAGDDGLEQGLHTPTMQRRFLLSNFN